MPTTGVPIRVRDLEPIGLGLDSPRDFVSSFSGSVELELKTENTVVRFVELIDHSSVGSRVTWPHSVVTICTLMWRSIVELFHLPLVSSTRVGLAFSPGLMVLWGAGLQLPAILIWLCRIRCCPVLFWTVAVAENGAILDVCTLIRNLERMIVLKGFGMLWERRLCCKNSMGKALAFIVDYTYI